ncbi:phosphatidate cytidylyltransferase [Pseudonocardia sp. MH-G8]|uniref:phosphatidate cytidylyltransferase n=1 Tax=Pseudonocardia sp. MH-G8 TaxID=1854588 RepID=UPI000BA1903C|nr:phosphatidate cytidylyltransferase [Pseudonocardia sp. MH-G8]OZM81790.1 phosphatidate cytidylyltransferase [Pseudonocardia sp. MH-G8]
MDPVTLTLGALGLGGAAVGAARRAELTARWRTWLLAAPLVLGPLLLGGRVGGALLAAALGAVAAVEFARLAALPRADAVGLVLRVVGIPGVALLRPDLLGVLLPVLAVSAALPALLTGDTATGGRRAAYGTFGTLWIGGGLAGLAVLEPGVAVAVCLAVAVADVGAWCGGKLLGRHGPGARPLSPLSPSKTWGGVVGATLAAAAVLLALGMPSAGLLVAVVAGGVLGDLLESMLKREAGRKDAGGWLPGFGGLLDRIDSLLVALPLAVLVTTLPGLW